VCILTILSFRLIQAGKLLQIIDKAPSGFFPDKVFISDIRNPLSLAFSSPLSAIINFAAKHLDDVRPLTFYDGVNVGGTRNVCELARAQAINKIIFTSSVALYGFAPLGNKRESGSIAPSNDYGDL